MLRDQAEKAQRQMDDYVCGFLKPAGSIAVCRIIVEYVGDARVQQLVRDHVVAQGTRTSTNHIAHTINLTVILSEASRTL